MFRTQVNLTKAQRDGLSALAKATGKRRSELIREAIDALLERYADTRRQTVLDAAAGMWKDRKDLPDFRALRSEWDRGGHHG
jgi:metal-responsive CopG/Arc/MetJ family transcriptional regulator